MPKFRRIVCGPSFCSAAFERGEWDKASLVQALERMDLNFSLTGGANGTLSLRASVVVWRHSHVAGRNFKEILQHLKTH